MHLKVCVVADLKINHRTFEISFQHKIKFREQTQDNLQKTSQQNIKLK